MSAYAPANPNTAIFRSTSVDLIGSSIICCLRRKRSAFVFAARRARNKRMRQVKPLTLFLSVCLGLFTTTATAALKPGDAAPDFTVDAALGGKEFKFSLTEALKKDPVGLYFFPKSFQ